MCGLVALLGTPTDSNELQAFKDLMTVSCLRGKDGSGMFAVKDKGRVRSVRSAFNAAWLVESKEAQDVLKDRNHIIVGHARYPTKGENTIEMAHPHTTESGNIIGVHNGTMHSVNSKYTFKSDSLELYESIDKIGVQETVNNSWGAYALMWVDKKAGTFNVLRNSERTLYSASLPWDKSPGIATQFMASEHDFLQLVLSRRFSSLAKFSFSPIPVHKQLVYPLVAKRQVIAPIEVIDRTPVRVTYTGGYDYSKGKRHPAAMDWAEVFGAPDAWDEELVRQGEDTTKKVGEKWNYETNQYEPIDQNGKVIDISASKRLHLSPEERAKRMAALRAHEAKKKETEPQSSSFRDMVERISDAMGEPVGDYVPVEREDIRHKGCCVCGEVSDPKDKIFSLHASTGVREYLCVPCASDPDYSIFVPPGEQHFLKPKKVG